MSEERLDTNIGQVQSPQLFEEAADCLESLELRSVLFGGFNKVSVYEAFQKMDEYYREASERDRKALLQTQNGQYKELFDENEMLRDRCSMLLQAQNRLMEERKPLEKWFSELVSENSRLRTQASRNMEIMESVGQSIAALSKRLLQAREDN